MLNDLHVDRLPVEKAKLRAISSAFYEYHIEKGYLLSEVKFKEQLKEYLEDESILNHVRYFTKENNFVLVSPVKNKIFDAPEGYDAIKDCENKGDDTVEWFGRVE